MAEPLKKTILIGSQAAAMHFNEVLPTLRLSRPAQDWDFSGPMNALTTFATYYVKNIISIQEIRLSEEAKPSSSVCAEKYRIRLRSGTVIEWEVAEFFESAKALENSQSFVKFHGEQQEMRELEFGTFPTLFCKFPNFEAASLDAICLMKMSHLYWPLSWSKTAKDLVFFSEWHQNALSVQKLIDSYRADRRTYLKKFHNTRLREAAFRWNKEHCHEAFSPVLSADLEGQFAPLKRDDELSPKELSFLTELVQKTIQDRFLRRLLDRSDAALASWLSDPSLSFTVLIEELWLLGLECICTNGRAKPRRRTIVGMNHVDAESAKIRAMYDQLESVEIREKYLAVIKPVANKEIAHKFSSLTLPKTFKPTAMTSDEVSKLYSHVNSAIVERLIRGLHALITPPPTFVNLVTSSLGALFPPVPSLPDEMWSIILGETDHQVIGKFSLVSKWAHSVSTRIWKPFTLRCWSLDRLERIKQSAGSRLSSQEAFKQAWVARAEELKVPKFDCVHCGEKHDTITYDEWHEYLDNPSVDWEFKEYAELWCICENCDAGSWHQCEQHDIQFQ